MRIKKVIFAVFISLFLVVTLSINVFSEEYYRGLFGAELINSNTDEIVGYPSVLETPSNYPIGAQNHINVLDYIKDVDFDYYVDVTIPDSQWYTLELTYPPLSAMGTEQGEYEAYVNNITVTLGIALTPEQYNTFAELLYLSWDGKPLDYSRSIKIISESNKGFYVTDESGYSDIITTKIYFIEASFHLNQPIAIDDAWNKTFEIKMLAPNIFMFDTSTYFTYYNGLHYQMATTDLSISTASLDDVVAEIGGKLDGINNNLIILQGLNEDILNALKENGYADEVEEYINNVQNTTNKTDSLASMEQALWDDVSFSDIGAEVDLGFFSNMSWLWNDWITMLVISLCAIATISYGLFGGS